MKAGLRKTTENNDLKKEGREGEEGKGGKER